MGQKGYEKGLTGDFIGRVQVVQFGKFVVVNKRDMEVAEEVNEDIYINYEHLVSIKPIQMVTAEGVVKGHWVRVSNGKKYRAVEIPADLKSSLGL